MTLDIQDFVEQASGNVSVEDIPPAVQERVNGALADLTGEESGPSGPSGDLYDAVVNAGSGSDDGSSPFKTIQAAVNEVNSGAVISVEAGTYDEQVSIDTRDITLFGAGQGETVIDASGNDGRGIEVNSPGVTLREFTVIGPDESSEGSYGVKIQPFSSDGDLPGNPATVDSITVKGSYKTELDLIGVQDGTVSNVVLNGQNTGGVGLALSNCKNVSLEDVETRDNNWGGVGLFTNEEFSSIELADITISNHTAANGESVAPIYLDPETDNYDLSSLVPSYQYKVTSEGFRDGDFQWFFETQSAANAYSSVLESDAPATKRTES
jgi:hypothetical protein